MLGEGLEPRLCCAAVTTSTVVRETFLRLAWDSLRKRYWCSEVERIRRQESRSDTCGDRCYLSGKGGLPALPKGNRTILPTRNADPITMSSESATLYRPFQTSQVHIFFIHQ